MRDDTPIGISKSSIVVGESKCCLVSGFFGVQFENTVPDKNHPDEID